MPNMRLDAKAFCKKPKGEGLSVPLVVYVNNLEGRNHDKKDLYTIWYHNTDILFICQYVKRLKDHIHKYSLNGS